MELPPVWKKLIEGYSCLSVASRRFWAAEVSLGSHFSRKGARVQRRSAQPIGATGEEFEEAQVSEDLELLADFVGDMGVFRMQFG
jgi:hypothetical protein